MSGHPAVPVATLKRFQPISALSESRLTELATLCFVEQVSKQLDPFRVQPLAGNTVYLVRGELALSQRDGRALVLVGGSDEARQPIGRGIKFESVRTITDVELIRFDDDLLDIMTTWDDLAQLESLPATTVASNGAVAATSAASASRGNDWRLLTGLFSLKNLQHGVFAKLPPAHIAAMLGRFERIPAKRGEVVVREGDDGDYYYLLEQGRAQVARKVGGVEMKLAQLKAGDAFGEEALLAEAKRNASVTMLADGALLRLAKRDFIELLKKPLLREIDLTTAHKKVADGAQWLDVRYPSEFQYDKIPGALNIPLAEIRNAAGILQPTREYVIYCQTGRRSSAAAFLLAQHGLSTYVLDGGLAKHAKYV